jgi:signal transduction histidine kinase
MGLPYRGEGSGITPRRRLLGLCRVLWQAQTYRNVLYLLLAFPLGLLYFIVLIVGLAVGAGTSILGVGLLLLLLTWGFMWAMIALERRLVLILLRVRIVPPAPLRAPTPLSLWGQVKAYLRRPTTWRSLAYLLVEFPFGVVSFTIAVTLLTVSAGLVLYPVFAVLDAVTTPGGVELYNLPQIVGPALPQPWAPLLTAALCLLAPLVGLPVTAGSLALLNGMAFQWGQFARLMLGTSDEERQLAEARERAAREEARAESADRRRRELIVNVSHELRTPIANIRGHVESLRLPSAERLSEAERQAYLAIVAREAERLSALVDDLLALARADAGELRLDLRPVAVGAVVEEVYQALAPLAQRDRQVTLVRTVAAGLPCALVDRDRLAQVLLNLGRNAITATPQGGLVFLDLEQAGQDHLALSVSDTGRGIPPEDLERIFERFYRSDASRTRATGGFGLGLSIVRDLVQAMGGTITVTSTMGTGSCFRVVLPVAPSTT